MADFKGGNILAANCANECIYVTEIEEDDTAYSDVYAKLADGKIKLVNLQAGADFRKTVTSNCLTVNYWIK